MGQAARAYRYEPEEAPSAVPDTAGVSTPDSDADPTPEMERLAADELSHALAHEWLELQGLVPWADSFPAEEGRSFEVVRSYRWADVEDGDMVCEVSVYELPNRAGHVIRRTCVLRRS
ncbi:MAG: hypothetical protein M3M95_01210 [Pseudomonadota bacterium]|nr:hypothetical protein [Pseudomonadota bacterium]